VGGIFSQEMDIYQSRRRLTSPLATRGGQESLTSGIFRGTTAHLQPAQDQAEVDGNGGGWCVIVHLQWTERSVCAMNPADTDSAN
jgi:hypothetical protein